MTVRSRRFDGGTRIGHDSGPFQVAESIWAKVRKSNLAESKLGLFKNEVEQAGPWANELGAACLFFFELNHTHNSCLQSSSIKPSPPLILHLSQSSSSFYLTLLSWLLLRRILISTLSLTHRLFGLWLSASPRSLASTIDNHLHFVSLGSWVALASLLSVSLGSSVSSSPRSLASGPLHLSLPLLRLSQISSSQLLLSPTCPTLCLSHISSRTSASPLHLHSQSLLTIIRMVSFFPFSCIELCINKMTPNVYLAIWVKFHIQFF